MGRQGKIYSGNFDMNWWITKQTVILFPCVATDFYGTVESAVFDHLVEYQRVWRGQYRAAGIRVRGWVWPG